MEKAYFVLAHIPLVISVIQSVLTVLIVIFMLVPGPEPERTLQKCLDFLTKFSRK